MNKKELSGWGNNYRQHCNFFKPKNINELKNIKSKKIIARGLGRSYGDSSFQKECTVDMTNLNKIIFYDKLKGEIHCQSGCSLKQILDLIIPDGWFIPVSPGTKYVTIGGMVASNVHGKNHHKVGSFKNFVTQLKILLDEKQEIFCDFNNNKDLFDATFGGMGLTGIITEVSFKLKKINSNLIKQRIFLSSNLNDLIKLNIDLENYEYVVSWINCSKNSLKEKSITFAGNHYENYIDKIEYKAKKNFFIPKVIRFSLINKTTIKVFNLIYYFINYIKSKESLVLIDTFFYPLDRLLQWNNLYGDNGFFQIQLVVPIEHSSECIKKTLNLVKSNGSGSFLTVIKLFKNESNYLSFPQKGFTLTIDLPNKDNNINLHKKIEEIMLNYDGKMYLTKDSYMKGSTFNQSYDLKLFNNVRKKYLKNLKYFSSNQSERLLNQ